MTIHDENTPDLYLEDQLLKVHDLILSGKAGPYEAWIRALKGEVKFLPDILDIDPKQCDRLLNDDQFVLPTEKVLRFCIEMRVDPANLQPGLDHTSYNYNYSVLDAMVQLLKEKKKKEVSNLLGEREVSPQARKLFFEAFNAQARRYEKEKEKSEKMREAIKYVEHGIILFSLSEHYNYTSSKYAPDVEAALDQVEQPKLNRRDEAVRELALATQGVKSKFRDLEENAYLVFGLKNPVASLTKFLNIISTLDAYDKLDDLSRRMEIETLMASMQQEKFAFECYEQGKEPKRVAREFIDQVDIYIKSLLDLAKKNSAFALEDDVCKAFLNWRRHPETEDRLSLIKSHKLIAPYLQSAEMQNMIEEARSMELHHG